MAEYVVEFGKDGQPIEPDGRLDAAAFHRNHQPIWAILQKSLDGKSGDVLEAGSGTGQHAVDFARRSPGITWWPSDLNEAHLKSCPIRRGVPRCTTAAARARCWRCSAPM
jgi:hypothetical protein